VHMSLPNKGGIYRMGSISYQERMSDPLLLCYCVLKGVNSTPNSLFHPQA
jgi:hypothetical protein